MQTYVVEDHAPSFLPDGKEWKLIWQDEFDGDALDETKWSFRLHIMGQRHETWCEDAVYVDGKSNLVFKVIEKDGEFYSSQLQTGENYMDRPAEKNNFGRFTWPIAKLATPKFMHKFGYYECRCKLQKKKGWWSAFWLQSPLQGSTLNPAVSGMELDIMESFKPNNIEHNIHWNGCGADWQCAGSGNYDITDTEDGYHLFGLLWTKEGYTFYVDGKETWHIDGPVSETEQFILISTECLGYRKPEREWQEEWRECLEDTFEVDYIRVFDEV